jgi:hypothetical protein
LRDAVLSGARAGRRRTAPTPANLSFLRRKNFSSRDQLSQANILIYMYYHAILRTKICCKWRIAKRFESG